MTTSAPRRADRGHDAAAASSPAGTHAGRAEPRGPLEPRPGEVDDGQVDVGEVTAGR